MAPRPARWFIVAIALGMLVIGGIVVASRQGTGLRTSPTCDEVEPGSSRLRSASPGGAAPTPEAGPEGGEAGAAFVPAEAEVAFCEDLADPFVLSVDRAIGRRLLVFGTGTPSRNVPMLIAGNVLRSEQVVDALPELPGWTEPGGVWAPGVLQRGASFVLYYTTTDTASGRQCISRATAGKPEGPYEDLSSTPMICPVELGGAIDPSPFVGSDGRVFLLWKNDGNCCGVPSRIFTQQLRDDGLEPTGPAVELLAATQSWEAGLVEAPSMVEHEDTWFLFYSANKWDTAAYAIGYATCVGPTGPCTKPLEGPWLAASDRAVGPGGQELYLDDGGAHRMVFHAWEPDAVGYAAGGFRRLYTVGVRFVGGRAVTGDP